MFMNRLFASALVALTFSPLATAAHPAAANYSLILAKDTTCNKKCKQEADTTQKKKETPYEKLIKQGGSATQGLFLVRHIKDKWYMELPDSLMSRLFLVVTRFTAVPQDFKMLSGEEVNHSAIYFEKRDDNILMREYVKSQFAPSKDNIAKALNTSTINPIVYKFNIIGTNPKTQAPLIDISKLFLSDNKVTSFSSDDRKIVSLGGLSADLTFIDSIRSYPMNMEVQTTRTYTVSKGKAANTKTGYATLGLNTSFVLLPKVPMQARLADERVGYFQNEVTDFSDKQQSTEHSALISRYRLEPKDPKRYRQELLTEPKKPIVYYIDPATPKQWIPYLKKGIEDWNKAFEAAGFKNAIQAKDWPNDPTMSLDDARFSVIRYLPSETQNAYGPRIVDPRSGEIIEAHVCWYHNVMALVKKWYITQCGPLDPKAHTMNFDDKLMGELIRFVSSHEVGHSLGLRHNMIASNATPVEKLRDKAWVEAHGHTASIMDYARFNYVAQPEDKISEKGLFPRINDYDTWAIKWGYQYRPEFKDAYAEKDALRKEVTQTLKGNKRLRYKGDEGKGIDCRSQAEDLGDNNMTANDYGVKNLKRVVTNILNWTAQEDGIYDDLEFFHKATRAQFSRYFMHVQKHIGGRYENNWPAENIYEIESKDMQKQAIDWIGRQVFDAPLWLYPDDVVNKYKVNANDEIRERQTTAISYMLSAGMLYTIYNNSLQATNPYLLGDYLKDVEAAVWKPINSKNERKNSYRRQLERSYIEALGRTINPNKDNKSGYILAADQSDIKLYALDHLNEVETKIKQLMSGATNINAEHYKALLKSIEKIRNKYNDVKE